MTAKSSDEHACLFGLIKSLGWSPATRDDEKILQAIEDDQPIDGIYSLNEEGLLDSFFSFLEEANIFSCIKEVSLEGYRRIMVPVVLLLLTYMTKLLIGIPSMNALPALLFSNTALMRIIGFNAHILENGSCRRGEHSRSPDKEPPTPFSAQTLANFVDRFSTAEVEDFFNSTIQALAAFGAFKETVDTIIDATQLETTENWVGCGVVTREK